MPAAHATQAMEGLSGIGSEHDITRKGTLYTAFALSTIPTRVQTSVVSAQGIRILMHVTAMLQAMMGAPVSCGQTSQTGNTLPSELVDVLAMKPDEQGMQASRLDSYVPKEHWVHDCV
jgi:hypothetical protein